MRTRRSSSTACACASDLLTARCVLTASVIWLPIRIVGLSDRAGSWNTMAMSLPRCLRSCASDRPIISLPRSRAEPADRGALGEQAHDGAAPDGLARAGLADDGKGPACLDPVTDAV